MRYFILIGLIAQTLWANAQTTGGTVTYKVNFESKDLPQEMVVTQMQMMFRGEKALFRVTMGGGMVTDFISDGKTSAMLLHQSKSYMTMPTSDNDDSGEGNEHMEDQDPTDNLTKTNERAKILGYDAIKYFVNSGGQLSEVWVSERPILKMPKFSSGNYNLPELEGIEGFPLKYKYKADGQMIEMIATEIKPTAPDASVFEIPKGYQPMGNQMMEMMQQMMQQMKQQEVIEGAED